MSAAAIESKDVATLQAEFALAGAELIRLADGTFLAACGGWIKPLGNLSEAGAFLARLTGRVGAPG